MPQPQPKTMRIVIIADPLDNQSAGVHHYLQGFLEALASFRHPHEIILVRERKSDDFPQFRQVVVPNTRLPIGWATFRLFFLVPIICRRLKADAVLEPAHFGPWNLPKQTKRITVIHDLTPLIFPQYHRWHSQMLQRLFLKRILRNADLVIANSAHTASDIARFFPDVAAKTKAIHLGKDAIFHTTGDPGILQEYGIDRAYFLFTGTIEPRKNLLTLLEAYRLFRQRQSKQVLLVLAGGKGWRNKEFYTALRSHPFSHDIRLLGYVERKHLPVLYSSCEAFVYPSEYEGFGLPVLEAMACGAPVLAARNSSLTEVGGKAAMYFSTHRPEALAALMMELMANPGLRTALKHQSLLQEKHFCWGKYVKEFLEALAVPGK